MAAAPLLDGEFRPGGSLAVTSHWVMVVVDVLTRHIVGFGIEYGDIDGVSACRMFNDASSPLLAQTPQYGSRSVVSLSALAGTRSKRLS